MPSTLPWVFRCITAPYKDWAKMAYKKMDATLLSLDEGGIDSLITSGAIVTYTAAESGYTRKANPSF